MKTILLSSLILPSKKLTIKISFFLFATFLIIASCKKEEAEPNDPILNPLYYDDMSAIINGKAWKASCSSSWPGFGCTKVHIQYYEDDNGFEIFAAGGESAITFSKSGGSGGVIQGSNVLPFREGAFRKSSTNCTSCCFYNLDTTHANTLNVINIDKKLKIIEGSFRLRVINNECNEIIMIENGYFKAAYRN